ncbi:CDF family Co(II)/Ni(II) efflux transporter DmeF [Arenibaculum pallidiluteum]|uniref:CDF family Co(II)/Ni(II) efflux transporter DmeF n=1 Tax=Arenibaculum pallidiluteum TaxID=2812559 RepID=UPI001A97BD03|nr:CDF family Co(II)/Ni(II) efflux transporter DmeF [Arenibaculum pallidiluteum]
MHTHSLQPWQHEHSFGQERQSAGERRTLAVVVLTLATMLAEIAGGFAFGSMALLADGVHMASHALALGISVFAYVYARRHARDARFSFGTGKVGTLAGFASALLLGIIALGMLWESAARIYAPSDIAFDQAIMVAVLGLAVNVASALILGHGHGHHHDAHDHDRDHAHHHDDGHAHRHSHGAAEHDDHNLRSAYLHVVADAVTSVLAIAALLGGKYMDADWLDPLMGVVGAVLVANWSRGLLRDSGRVLLDWQAPPDVSEALRRSVERDGDRVADLHVWSIGPGIHAAIVSIVTHDPRPPGHYHGLVPPHLAVRHLSVEVHRCG